MPPEPADSSSPQLCSMPKAQPLRMSGKVSQLGTLSFQPSMTAATIMAAQMNDNGQWLRMNCMRRHPLPLTDDKVTANGSAKAGW